MRGGHRRVGGAGWLTPPRRRVAIVSLLVALIAVASSRSAVPRSIIPDVEACGTLPAPEPGDGRVSRAVPSETAPTISEHARAAVDVPGMIDDVRTVVAEYRLRHELVLEDSGMRIRVHSDGPVRVDAGALAQFVRLPLEEHLRFGDRRMRALARCYRERIMTARELAGTTLRLYVPADPEMCVVAGRLVRRETHCDAGGFTVPPVELSVPGIRLAAPGTVLIAPGVSPADGDPGWSAAWLLLHELMHHYDNHLGLPPWRGTLKAYEQRAYYVERELRRLVIDGRLDLPRPLRWPAETG